MGEPVRYLVDQVDVWRSRKIKTVLIEDVMEKDANDTVATMWRLEEEKLSPLPPLMCVQNIAHTFKQKQENNQHILKRNSTYHIPQL